MVCRIRSIWAASWQNQQMTLHPAKTQISLGIRPVWSESSLCAQWVAKDLSFLNANSEDSDQMNQSLRWAHNHIVGFVMRRLIWQRQYIKHTTGASLLCRRLSSFDCPNDVLTFELSHYYVWRFFDDLFKSGCFDIRAESEYQVLYAKMLFRHILTFELSHLSILFNSGLLILQCQKAHDQNDPLND